MNVHIDGETERLIHEALASGEYRSAEDFITAMIQRYARNTSGGGITEIAEDDSIEKLATEQGVGPIRDFRDLKADFWPEGESSDEFLSAIRTRREFDTPRVR